jgi:hypothetical protein
MPNQNNEANVRPRIDLLEGAVLTITSRLEAIEAWAYQVISISLCTQFPFVLIFRFDLIFYVLYSFFVFFQRRARPFRLEWPGLAGAPINNILRIRRNETNSVAQAVNLIERVSFVLLIFKNIHLGSLLFFSN